MLLNEIANLVNGEAEFSETDNRIYVKFIGFKNVRLLQDFMSKHGFNYVYGAYEKSVYELGFSEGEGF